MGPHGEPVDEPAPTAHGTCVAIGGHGILILGPSGAGKSTLALTLILDPPRCLPPAELVADDRVVLEAQDGRLTARPPPLLAGLIEVRGLGIRRIPHRPVVQLSHVVEIDPSAQFVRMPNTEALSTRIQDCRLQRIAGSTPAQAALLLAAVLSSSDYQN